MTQGTPRRVALVTGAASGIGAAVAARLQRGGWAVAGLDLQPCTTELAVVADVTDAAAVAVAAERATAELGPVELLVTVAGYYEMLPFAEVTPERWQRMIAVHLGGTRNACAAVLPGMLAAGSGCIVTISSELALAGGVDDAHYAAAKGAIVGLTRSLAAEMAPRGIRVNSVAPGPCDTPLLPPDSPWRAPEYLATLPAGRLVRPDEIAETVAFLAEEGTAFAGQVVSANAGAVI
jgi:2-hydroxycyclohexanecarboxyl-CoA dehydrogenase